ncbi:hypothetical protein ARZXY2_1231 [Arthrobacter sp. ZXY-2]|jgi:hypothetical protein|nr:hypothetical protein ARZXY2_1231 [Arthrobacter sp. ZXY-2]
MEHSPLQSVGLVVLPVGCERGTNPLNALDDAQFRADTVERRQMAGY